MTSRDLIAAFETLSEAPDGVERLRELVLQLAVRGRLVPQDPADEPAEVLLERAAQERLRLSRAGEGPQGESPPTLVDSPGDLPPGWVWTCTSALGLINPRYSTDDDRMAAFAPMPVIPTEFREKFVPEQRRWGDIKKGYTHFSNGDVMVAKITPCFQNRKSCVVEGLDGVGAGTTELHVVRPLGSSVDPRYLLVFYKTPAFIDEGVARMTGTAGQQRVPRDYFSTTPLPLPPLAEQHRIVARVDELMDLLDRLEAARTMRETTRTAVRDSALAALRSANAPDEVAVAWNRFAERIEDLVIDPSDIEPLREAVLELAVRGRLISQDPADEAASTLLDGTPIEEQPYMLPDSWVWATLDALCDPERQPSYGVLVPGPDVKGGIPLVRVAELSARNPPLKPEKSISASVADQYERVRLRGDELLVGVVGSIGKVGVARPEWKGAVVARAVVRFGVRNQFLRSYVLLVLMAPFAQKYFHVATRTLAQPTLNVGQLRSLPVPLPPFREQERIVARVDELMDLLDRLEDRLTAARSTHAAFAAAAVNQLDA